MTQVLNPWDAIESKPETPEQKAVRENARKRHEMERHPSGRVMPVIPSQETQETPEQAEERRKREQRHAASVFNKAKRAAMGPIPVKDREQFRKIKENVRSQQERKKLVQLVVKGENNAIDVQRLTQEEIVQKLIERDNRITDAFFFGKCAPMLNAVIGQVLGSYHVDYNSLINEFYYYLMKPGRNGEDAINLQSFHFDCSLYSWLKVVAIRFFLNYRQKIEEDMQNNTETLEEEGPDEDDEGNQLVREWDSAGDDAMSRLEASRALEKYMEMMVAQARTRRAKEAALKYVTLIRELVLEEKEPEQVAADMEINLNNLYVQKKRALEALTRVALQENNV